MLVRFLRVVSEQGSNVAKSLDEYAEVGGKEYRVQLRLWAKSNAERKDAVDSLGYFRVHI